MLIKRIWMGLVAITAIADVAAFFLRIEPAFSSPYRIIGRASVYFSFILLANVLVFIPVISTIFFRRVMVLRPEGFGTWIKSVGGVLLVLSTAVPFFMWGVHTDNERYLVRMFICQQARFVGNPAPDVSGTTLDGQIWHLRDMKGKVVVLDFWATWCGPCRRLVPLVKQLHDEYKDRADFEIIGVSEDMDQMKLKRFLSKQGIDWREIVNFGKRHKDRISRAFGIRYLPCFEVIDKEGKVRLHRSSSPYRVEEVVTELLATEKQKDNSQ